MKIEIEIDDNFIETYGKEITKRWISSLDSAFEEIDEIEDVLNSLDSWTKFFILYEDTDEYLNVQEEDMSKEDIIEKVESMKVLEKFRDKRRN